MFYTGSFLCDVVGLATALLAITIAYYKWTFQYWKRKNMPYLEPEIPFGNLGNPLYVRVADKITEMYREAKARGWKYCCFYKMFSSAILIVDLELVKHVLTKDFAYFMDRGAFSNEEVDPLDAHLFALTGTRWKNLRGKLTPTFTSGKLKAMFQTLVDCGLVLEEYIEGNIKPNQPVDIKELLACFSTDVVGSCAFGIDCNSFKDPNSEFRTFGNSIFQVTPKKVIKGIFLQTFPRLARLIKMKAVTEDVGNFFKNVINDTVSYRDKNNVKRKDFLQLLIEIRNPKGEQENGPTGDGNTLTLGEITAQSFIFFAAGFETSSTTMTFALFELALHQGIQKKLRDEIIEVLKANDNKITYDSLNEMKYLEQVIQETFRLHGPAEFLERLCIKDYKIPGEDAVIEKGTHIFVAIRGPQIDEEYWEDPLDFKPERFSEEKRGKINQYIHMPFGQGPRNCIGERFGLMQVKVGLACLLRKFKVTLNKKTKLPLKLTTLAVVPTAEGGIWLNLEKI